MFKNFVFLMLGLCWVISGYAAPCYGTKMPMRQGVILGLQSHVISKRYLEDEFGKLRSAQHFLLLSYGIFDWLSIDLKGGAGFVKQHPVGSDEVDYPSSFAGGYGFRLRLYDKANIRMVFGFQHISIHPRSVRLGSFKNKAVLDDWQTSFLISRSFNKFTPYLGIKGSRVDYIHWVEENRKRRMSDLTKSLGLVLGLDIPIAEETWINLEGHLFDGESCALSINYKF